MIQVNWGRVALAGLVAGLIFNVGGMTSAYIVDLPGAFARFGVEPTAGTALLHVGLRFGLGLAAVLGYVAVRAGLGPGPATAAKVGALVWFVGYVPGSFVLHELGVLDTSQLAIGLVWGLGESLVATLAGARLYREA